MTELPSYPDSMGDASAEPSGSSTPGAPRQVNIVGIVAVVLVVAIVIVLHLTGVLGPGLHSPR